MPRRAPAPDEDDFTFRPPPDARADVGEDEAATPSPSRPFGQLLGNFPDEGFSPVLAPPSRAASARDVTVITLGVVVIASASAYWLLQVLAYLLRPLVTAVGAALLLRPLVDFVSDKGYQRETLRRHRARLLCCGGTFTVPRIVAIVLALAVTCAVFGTLIWALYLGRVYVAVHVKDPAWYARFTSRVNAIGQSMSEAARRIFKKDDIAEQAWDRLQNEIEGALKDAEFWENLGVGAFHYLQDVMLMLFYTLFLLLPRRELSFSRSLVVRRIRKATRRFVSIMVQIAMVRALLVGVLLGLCRMPWPLAIAIAIVSFWLFFIPTLGSIIASILPLPIIVLLPDMTANQRAAGVFIPNLVSFLVGDLIGPVVYRKGLDLNEVTVLFALVFWYSVWGAPGAVLGVPLTCALKIVLEEIPHEGAHALASVMAPAQAGSSREGLDSSHETIRVPMTFTFIAWVKRKYDHLFMPRQTLRPRTQQDEEALLDSSSDSSD